MAPGVGDIRRAPGDGFSVWVQPESGEVRASAGFSAQVVERGAKTFVVAGSAPGATPLTQNSTAVELTELGGGFAAVEIDQGARVVRVTTDRVASRKVFHGTVDGWHGLSTDLSALQLAGRALDPGGIGSYLASEGVLDGLTPYDGIRTIPRATVTQFGSGSVTDCRYWDFEPTEQSELPREEAIEEMRSILAHLMRSAAGTGPVYVSLSGGLDSRSQAAYLVREFGADRIRAVTYHHGNEASDSDLASARWAADLLGIRLEIVDGYRGDLPGVLDANARLGSAMARVSDEVDAWLAMQPVWSGLNDPVLVVGDVFGQHPRRDFTSADGYLRICGVRPARTVDWFLRSLPDPASIRDAWTARYEMIRATATSFDDPMHGWEYTYLDQRITHTLGLWRERIQGPFIRVAAPYVQPAMLDFMARIPWAWKVADGAVYQQALERDFPRLFERPGASGGWNQPNWLAEIRRFHTQLLETLDEPSPLDALVPPSAIALVLEELGRRRTSDTARQWLSRRQLLKRGYRPMADRTGRVPARSPARLVRDVLVLRRALALLEKESNSAVSPLGRSG